MLFMSLHLFRYCLAVIWVYLVGCGVDILLIHYFMLCSVLSIHIVLAQMWLILIGVILVIIIIIIGESYSYHLSTHCKLWFVMLVFFGNFSHYGISVITFYLLQLLLLFVFCCFFCFCAVFCFSLFFALFLQLLMLYSCCAYGPNPVCNGCYPACSIRVNIPQIFLYITLEICGLQIIHSAPHLLAFYAWKQLLLSARLSHRNSVCPSHRWISQKRCKLESPNLHRRLPRRL